MEIQREIRNKSMRKDIKYSLIFHAAVFGAFSIKNIFFSSPDIQYTSAIRVDIVDLPDKIVNQAKVIPAKEEPKKPEEKKPPPPKPKKKQPAPNKINLKSKQKSAIDRLEALNKIKEQKDREDDQKDALNKIKEFKGNTLSKGSSLKGVAQDQFNAYVDQMDTHVKQFWSLPRWLSEEKISCSVRVKIDSRGVVIFRQVTKSSGNPSYDDIALSTVDQASPFPAPPDSISGTLEANGFTIEFQQEEE